jgi:hypothetical protein
MTSVSAIYLADAFAIREMGFCVPAKHRPQLWSHLTDAVEDGRLGFPKEVAEHLAVVARDEQAASWAAGLGASLGIYATNIKFNRPFMKIVYDLGFDQGIESLDDKDTGIIALGRLACEYAKLGTPFIIATEDLGVGPLAPTMEQICGHTGWQMENAKDCLNGLGLSGLLVD